MSHCPPVSFEAITPEKFNSLLQLAQSQGLQITSPSGTTSYQGMTFTWNYDPTTQSLSFQCTEKPIFIPCSIIESKIRSLLT